MGRVLVGAVAAAFAMFIIGFIFFATPLAKIGSGSIADAQAAAIQQSLSANLPGTGTWHVPSGETPAQTVMYGQGPIATIHYNASGFPTTDAGALVGGLILDFVVALLIGVALLGLRDGLPSFNQRARVVVLFSVAAAAYMHLGQPIWYHHDVPHFVYMFMADAVALAAGGLIIARWFLPRTGAVGTRS
jgi:hypothetical protein